MEVTKYFGSTSLFCRVDKGVVLKYPISMSRESQVSTQFINDIAHSFSVERQILEHLGSHLRVVRYLGWHNGPGDYQGLLLAEASQGSLQHCLDHTFGTISQADRNKWCIQAVEAIVYIHSRGVIHSDLRPENFLVHATSPTSLDLWLCDFGGSNCNELGLDGGHLPDSGFFDPKAGLESTPCTDIFSIGSIMYTILTGHWPYRDPGGRFKSGEEMDEYRQRVDHLFEISQFPNVRGLFAGDVIMKCWMNEYASAEELLMEISSIQQ